MACAARHFISASGRPSARSHSALAPSGNFTTSPEKAKSGLRYINESISLSESARVTMPSQGDMQMSKAADSQLALVPTRSVGTPVWDALRPTRRQDATRSAAGLRSHAERGNEEIEIDTPNSLSVIPVDRVARSARSKTLTERRRRCR